MACKCKICGSNEVNNEGDICELCRLDQDSYAQGNMTGQPAMAKKTADSSEQSTAYMPKNKKKRTILLGGGGAIANTDPYGNPIIPTQGQSTPAAQTNTSGQAVGKVARRTPKVSRTKNTSAANQPITAGIVKNIVIDTQERSVLAKWFNAVFRGIPYSLDDTAVMFQVFPDFTGTALNAQGNACDQVVIYGRLAAGAICENNNVEVYGRRDHSNIVVAKRVKNVASGTWVTPQRVIDAGIIRFLTLSLIALLVGLSLSLGPVGIVWMIILVLCFTNLPTVLKIFGVIFGIFFSFFKRR